MPLNYVANIFSKAQQMHSVCFVLTASSYKNSIFWINSILAVSAYF